MAFFQSHLVIVVLVVFSFNWSSTLGSLDNLLEIYGLPQGLFPENVKGYSLDENMVLEVELPTPCLTMSETFVFYEKVVRANLTEGKLLSIKGMSIKELFVWFPVKAIIVNYPIAGVVMFDITMANKTLSLSHFDQPPSCRSESINTLVSGSQGQMPLKPKNDGSIQELGWGIDKVKKMVWSILDNYF